MGVWVAACYCLGVAVLNPTKPELLVDGRGRPYFLWDEPETTLAEFRARLAAGGPEEKAYDIGKLMRQAKPDDVFLFVAPSEIAALWPRLERYLGRQRELWTTLFDHWEALGLVAR